jgi:molecular chaperone DnaK (HSP70)
MGVVGIDFGTATTLMATRPGWGPAAVLPLGHATSWLPSVAWANGAGIVVGEEAENGGPQQIRSIKRAITERRETVIVPGDDGPREVEADAVIVAILTELAGRASRRGALVPADSVVRMGCPAMWDGPQRKRLVRLAAQAGLAVTDAALVDEPVAAGMAWLSDQYLRRGERPRGTLLVFDMGGGTLDIAVLSVAGGPEPDVAVLACLGVPLAGDALDTAIARDIAAEMEANRIDVAFHPRPELAWALLERAGREAKVRLSYADEHPIVLPRQLAYPKVVRYRHERLEQAFATQLDGAENLVLSALRASRLTRLGTHPAKLRGLDRATLAGDVDFVLLAGGMSRLPYVGRRLSALFPHAAIHDNAGVAPEETVVAGLADTAGYERISLHRPGFDIVLEWDGGRRPLYEAFTPLYQPWEVYSGHSDLGYERRLAVGELPSGGTGLVRVVSATGEPVRLDLDGAMLDGLPVRFGPAGCVLRAYADGRMSLVDGEGTPLHLRCDAWPVLRDQAVLPLRRTT